MSPRCRTDEAAVSDWISWTKMPTALPPMMVKPGPFSPLWRLKWTTWGLSYVPSPELINIQWHYASTCPFFKRKTCFTHTHTHTHTRTHTHTHTQTHTHTHAHTYRRRQVFYFGSVLESNDSGCIPFKETKTLLSLDSKTDHSNHCNFCSLMQKGVSLWQTYLLDLLCWGVWCLGVDCPLSPLLSLEWVGEVATDDIAVIVLALSTSSMYSVHAQLVNPDWVWQWTATGTGQLLSISFVQEVFQSFKNLEIKKVLTASHTGQLISIYSFLSPVSRILRALKTALKVTAMRQLLSAFCLCSVSKSLLSFTILKRLQDNYSWRITTVYVPWYVQVASLKIPQVLTVLDNNNPCTVCTICLRNKT